MPAPLSKEWITAQLALCEKATQGPWLIDRSRFPCVVRDLEDYCIVSQSTIQDGVFIAAAREGYPLVLKRLQHFRASYPLVVKMIRHLEKLTVEEAADSSTE